VAWAAPARIEPVRRAIQDYTTPRPAADSIEAAAICAMSSSLGGVWLIVPSASRNIVWQKGQAVPTTAAPVAASSVARSTFTRLYW
jgi:hypothetical protein